MKVRHLQFPQTNISDLKADTGKYWNEMSAASLKKAFFVEGWTTAWGSILAT